MKKIKKYLKVWWLMTKVASEIAFTSRFGAVVFIIGKILRFSLFLFFLVLLSFKTQTIAGYSLWQMIFFFATFNLIDSLPQFFLREVYRFRSYIITGYFDYILTKPFSSLFRSLFGGSDILDLFILFISVFFIYISALRIEGINSLGIVFYIFLIFNSFLISLSLHILVITVGVITTEVDNTIMLYRDLTQMGRVPIDVYLEPVRSILTFAIPVGIMITFPAKALMGLLSLEFILISFIFGISVFILSIFIWKWSLKFYSSASS